MKEVIIISKSFRGETLVGKTFGRLTVLEFISNDKSGTWWLCKCSCKEKIEKAIRGDRLKNGTTKSCGCLSKELLTHDLSGQIFGRLTVIEQANQRASNRNIMWRCQCDCDNKIVEVAGSSLLRGLTKSCGCWRQESAGLHRIKDLLGQVFGKLTVIEQTDKRINKRIIWKCKCSCPEETIVEVISSNLIRGNTTSCGCINYSIGEKNIGKILKDNNINYIPEKTFDGLVSPIDNKTKLRFDFAIYKNKELKYIIEFDGPQHEKGLGHWGGEEQLKKTQINDKLKNEYCIKNNIPLIRLPYRLRDNITLDLLKVENNTYIIK